MTQSDAEEALGYKIRNLLFGNEGYVVTDNITVKKNRWKKCKMLSKKEGIKIDV